MDQELLLRAIVYTGHSFCSEVTGKSGRDSLIWAAPKTAGRDSLRVEVTDAQGKVWSGKSVFQISAARVIGETRSGRIIQAYAWDGKIVYVSLNSNPVVMEAGIFDPATGRDSLLSVVVQYTDNGVTAFSGTKLFFLNAVHPDYPGTRVVSYDLATGTWEREPNLDGTVLSNSAVAANGMLYALTRTADPGDSLDVHVMDIATQIWTVKKRHASDAVTSLAAVDDEVFLSTSFNGPFITTWKKYDPAADSWAAMVISPRMRATLNKRLVGVNGSIYSLGGISSSLEGLNQVERFDSVQNLWVAAPELRIGGSSLSAVAIGSSIYILGESETRKVEEYIPE